MVKLIYGADKKSLKGAEGGWKDYLVHHDKKLENTMGDPARRPKDFLVAFLYTFPSHFQKYFEKMIKRYIDCKMFLHFDQSPNLELPQMRLVRLTAEHQEYTRNYVFPSYKEGWEFITLGKAPGKVESRPMIAIRCETVLCTDGTEALVCFLCC